MNDRSWHLATQAAELPISALCGKADVAGVALLLKTLRQEPETGACSESSAIRIGDAGPVTHQTTGVDELP
jgi:hypothetical protein